MLYRRHTDPRDVPAAQGRVLEGGDGSTATTSTDVRPGTAEGAVSADAYSLDELREQARELDVSASGTKAEIAERINAKLAE